MYTTIRRYESVADPAEAGRLVREHLLAILRAIPGFIAYYWADAGDGVMISTSVFSDRAAAEESNRRAADWIRENAPELLPVPPQITAGEVAAHAAA
jgi:quinol monooxygenase YgiN